jgi:3-dehydroquinate dehydratase-1
MICVAISDKNMDKCISTLDKVELAEIRLDLTGFGLAQIEKVFAHPTPTIATCRPDKMRPVKQLELLTAAIHAGANYVDIEIEADKKQQEAVIGIARKHGCKVIISYHNFEETPGLRELYKIVDHCYDLGADIAKMATLTRTKMESARLLSLYSMDKPLVVLGMGEEGKITRIMAPLLGAEFTFAAMDEGEATAPGQIRYSRMQEILSLLNKELHQNKK